MRSWSKIDSYTLWHAVAKLEADKKGAHNRATGEARAAAAASGTLPLDYMLGIMRDPAGDHKRRDAMAMAAAPYLHPRLTAIDAKLNPAARQRSERPSYWLSCPPGIMPEKIRSKAFSRPHYVARLSLTAGAGEGHSHQPMDDALCSA